MENTLKAIAARALTKSGKAEADKQATEVVIMRDGLSELFWIELKENQGDYDAYIAIVSELHQSLQAIGSQYFKGDGTVGVNYKPVREQYAILKKFIDTLKEDGDTVDLSLERLQKFAERRKERKAKRINNSYDTNYEQFNENKLYARTDNELAIEERELKTRLNVINTKRFAG